METQKNFIELRDLWGQHALNTIYKDKKDRFVKGLFNIGFWRKLNPKKVIAIVAVTINTPLPTLSIVTNPILYKKIMKFNTDKFGRKVNVIKMRFM